MPSNKRKNTLSRIKDRFVRKEKSLSTQQPAPGSSHGSGSSSSSPPVPLPNATPTSTGIPNNQNFSTDPALIAAIDACAAKLSDHDKDAFRHSSPKDIMDKISAIDQADPLKSFSTRVGKILSCVNSFVHSVETFIQHSPEISSLVVGGLGCVLHLVLDYVEFFESLTSMIERIGEHLEYLSKYSSKVFQKSPDVQKALVGAYCDLLDFFVAIRKVFANKEGRYSYLQSFKLFLRVTWEPFESRFKPIEEKFLNHTLVVVRTAGVEDLITRLETLGQRDQADKVEKRRKVLEWLSSVDYEQIHEKHFKKHFKNTGQWLIEDPRFVEWETSPESSLLWCHGIPGTGKTVLASLVVEKLSAKYGLSSDNGISFVYCNYKEPHEAVTYMRAALKQLARRIGELPVELEKLYDNASNPGHMELQDCFIRISNPFKRVFFILDALDECTQDQKNDLFEVFRSIVGTSSRSVKLFITSRRESDIERAFKTFPLISIEAKKVDEDIKLYITSQLKNLEPNDASLKDEVVTRLVSRAGGMFLWIDFQLKDIFSQISDDGIREALGRLPEDMTETYKRIIESISNMKKPKRELARRALMWIAYAKTPLTVDQLREAVAMEVDTANLAMLKSKMSQGQIILDVCQNLVVFEENSSSLHGYDNRVVRFVHFSVQEFILQDGSVDSFLNLRAQLANTEIAKLSINYIMFCWIPMSDNSRAYYDLFNYCTSFWDQHVRILPLVSNELIIIIYNFLKSPVFFEESISFVLGDDGMDLHIFKPQVRTFSPTVLALIFNLPLISNYLNEHHEEKEYPEDRYAIHYAAMKNSCDAARRLLRGGICHVDELNDEGETPLMYASGKEVCQFLLENGANPNTQGGEYGYALHAATIRGIMEVVQSLLDRGADVNAQGGKYGYALQAAASSSDKEVVQLLLDRGADVNAQGGHYGYALQAAASRGHEEMMRLLLDRGADVNAQGGCYGYALQAAASSSDKVQLLLDRGADVNAKGGHYGYALQAAAIKGHKEVVQLFLDRGADVNAQGGKYGYALQAAAFVGGKEVVQLLLDRGADVNAQGGEYGSALQAAGRYDMEEIKQLLLDRGGILIEDSEGELSGDSPQGSEYSKSIVTLSERAPA